MIIGIAVALVLAIGLAPTNVGAMAPGRTWAPIDTLKLDHAYIVPSRFEPIRNGRIEVIGRGYYGAAGRRMYGFEWADSAWRVRWASDAESYTIWPTLTPPERQMLVWKTTTATDSAYHYFDHIVTADVVGDTLTPPDTIARVDAASLVYSGGSWGQRRWVAVRDGNGLPGSTFLLFRSDSVGQWKQMRTSDLGGYVLVLAPLDSSSVMVVTTERNFTLRWGILRDTTWTTEPVPLNRSNADYGGVISIMRQSGGRFRLAWAAFDGVLRSRVYQNGSWGEPESIRVALPDTIQHLFYEAELSREESDHPALAWYGYKIRDDVAYYIWVAFPADSGFGVGEKLPGSWEGINPTCLVDENGDVWVAWWRTFDGMYWTHSYCTATAGDPIVGEDHGRPLLRWSLSDSAPGTWWAILRSVGGASPEAVARVRAGADVSMSWPDSTAPTGAVLRYSVRRECRDVRYRLTSAEAEWRPRGPSLELVVRSQNPASTAVRFELSGAAAGTLDVMLYDLFGRRVLVRRQVATGSGVDRFDLTLPGGLRSGLYFLRARAADGRTSRAARVVVVR